MPSISVSNLDLFRVWQKEEELDLGWLLTRMAGGERTPAMMAGDAFAKAKEFLSGSTDVLTANGWEFHIECDIAITLPQVREMRVSKQYGDLLVRGRVDGLSGNMVEDDKTTGQFDPDRYLAGYQWRYYLDMTGADTFRWNVFVLHESEEPLVYVVTDFHQLEQKRYPTLHEDCAKLAREFTQFAEDTGLFAKLHTLGQEAK